MIERRIEKTTFENGLVILSEPMEHMQTVALGIWIRAGSRHESTAQNGITHFIEHAVFKGTRRRSAREIALEADILGGNLNAFTTQEFTGYYIKSLTDHLARSFDLLADLIIDPLFDLTELERERDVILEEIKMVEDAPDEMIDEIFASNFWPNHPLGRPIQGTSETVKNFTREDLVGYFQQVYHPKNIVIAAAGKIDHKQLVDMVARYFAELRSQWGVPAEAPPQPHADIIIRKKRALEQTHIILGAPCPSALAPERYAINLFSTILGGGLCSRLFQSVRERHGLAYSVFSSVEAFRDVGCMSIYLAVSNKRVRKAIDLVMTEIRLLKENPVSSEELQANKDQIKTGIILALDSVTARLNNLAEDEIIYGRPYSLEEELAGIDRVTIEDIQNCARSIFQSEKLTLAILGAGNRLNLDRKHLNC